MLTNRPRNGSDSDNVASDTQSESHPALSIPVNKGSKKYSVRQAFQVWFSLKDDVLSDVSIPVKNGESYKLSTPQQIYHLDLHDASGTSDDFSLDENIQLLSIDTVSTASSLSRKTPLSAPPNLPLNTEHRAPETQQLVRPENIQWVYLDPAGNEQGPFSGDLMQEWLTDGYLSLDLQIRRKETPRFQTLKLFCELVQNYIQPFSVPLPDLSQPVNLGHDVDTSALQLTSTSSFQQPAQQSSFGLNLYSQLLPNGGLGAAKLRTPLSNHIFDFMGSSDYSLMNQLQFPAGSQFAMDSSMSQGMNQGMNQGMSQGMSQGIGGSFSQLHMPSLLQQQIQQPQLSRNSSGWGVPSASVPVASSALGMNLPGMSLGGLNQGIGQTPMGQPGPISPWATRMQLSVSRVSSPFTPNSTLDQPDKPEDSVLHDLHSSMVTGILGDDDHRAVQPEPFHEPVRQEPYYEQRVEQREPEPAQVEPQPTQNTYVPEPEPVKEEEPIPEPIPEPVEVPVEKPVSPVKEHKVLRTETQVAEEPAQPVLAPWAASSSAQQGSALTLKQIQELEAERMQREKQLKAEMMQEAALASALAAASSEEKSSSEKLSFKWANASTPAVAKKTLAEIQREEEALAAKTKATKSSVLSSNPSLASTLATSSPRDDGNAWTTVSSKKPAVKKTTLVPQPGLSYSAASAANTPQALRAASTTVAPSSISTSATNALREDFLVWARSAMTNLYPSVSKNDLLELFTTLPAQSDSAQLISETIYSSSATMDGRRFAQEFIKKRQQVEKQIGAGGADLWSSAIASSADKIPLVDDDGWSTSVKSKKKGKKN